MEKFWIIWKEAESQPITARFSSRSEAECQAFELAETNSPMIFYVGQIVSCAKTVSEVKLLEF